MYGNGGGQAVSTAGGNATQPNAPKTNPVDKKTEEQLNQIQLETTSRVRLRTLYAKRADVKIGRASCRERVSSPV